MKKVVSCLLSISILFSMCAPALAYDEDTHFSNIIVLTSNGHGEYTSVTAASDIEKNADDTIIATATEDAEILYFRDAQYFVLVNNNNYILANKIAVDVNDFDANEIAFNQYDISDDMRNDIDAVITAQKQLGNEDLEIEVYAPSILSDVTQPLTNEPIGNSYYNYTYGKKTYRMKDYIVKYANLSTGMIEKTGSNVLNIAKSWSNFVVSATGAVSKIVTAFGIFSSAYDLFRTYAGDVKKGSSNDRIYTNLIYDRLVKRTYVDMDGYSLGCISHKVWLNRHDSYQYYGSTGQSYLGKHPLNSEHYSENFQNPAPTAIQFWGGSFYDDEALRTSVFNTTIMLTGT